MAQSASSDGGAPPPAPSPAPVSGQDVTPPALQTHPAAAYPPEALQQKLEANVGLELTIDESGAVSDARVTTPAGHGFDEAAIAAARQFVFMPARRGGAPIRATVEFNYEFHLPPEPPPVPVAPETPKPLPLPAQQKQQAGESTLVLATRPISAASSFSVRDRDFSLRPIGSVQDILRVTPGLVMVQHSGGGKANQYFLRGFDADHGTDLALSIDGVPINMVSHAHGQGFADTNFIIPEAVERVEVTKGPYFANQGDFATAGAVNMITRDDFEHSSVGLGFGGTPGHGAPSYRALLIASPKLDSMKATFAADIGRQNGPFDNPENWDKYKLFNKVTFDVGKASSISIGEMSYGANWHGSGQIPARAVDQGVVSRFGSIDPDEGGNTSRHQVFAQYKLHPSENSELRLMTYVGTYRFNLYSNFTLFLNDPENGDEIQQIDRRTFYGGKMSYRVVQDLGGMKLDTTLGADGRNDDIHEELWHTAQRQELNQLRGNDVHETFVGAFVNEEITPIHWFRLDLGGRADLLSFAVDNQLATPDASAPHSGVDAAHQFSPKVSAVITPVESKQVSVDVYGNYGHGFHSNDVRGAFTTPSVTPLTRAIGEELGSRARFFGRWDLAAALWQLDLANETVWNGDDGTTSVSGATTRRGVEVETRYEFTPWLAADLDLTFTKSQFSTDRANGGGLALAPKQTWAGGISARHEIGPGVARAGLRFYGIGDRPASDDGVIVAPGFTQFDLHLGYRTRRFDLAFDVENLLDGNYRSAQFDTVSRLRSEPALGSPIPSNYTCGKNARLASAPGGGAANGHFFGCEEVDYTPAYPLTMRVMATLFID
ncbi:MAG TPA: TonB family protein [Polyangiaceae bacterium]|nr:TonB family protein [Polyangiaceae bacterium]